MFGIRIRLASAILSASLAIILILLCMEQPSRAAARPLLTTYTFPGAAPCNTTLQACIDSASAGDVINIEAGTYNNTSVTLNKAVSLIGADSATTILNAVANQRVMTVTSASINSATLISGLTLSGGNADTGSFSCPQDCGGGILVTGNAQPLLQNLIIRNNAAREGGGLYADSGSVLILNNVSIISNTASSYGGGALTLATATFNGGRFELNVSGADGGGLDAEATVTITGTQFLSNTAASAGGGIFSFGAATIMQSFFQNNHSGTFGGALDAGAALNLSETKFISNSADAGGGALYVSSSAQVVNSVFARNVGPSSNAAALSVNAPASEVTLLHASIASANVQNSAAIYIGAGTVGITNTIVASHTVGISNTGGTAYQNFNLFFANGANVLGTVGGGANSRTGDPRFVNPAGDDYHLMAGSDAIDAGTNAGISVDLDLNPRPRANGFDIGAYESSFTGTLKLYLPLVVR